MVIAEVGVGDNIVVTAALGEQLDDLGEKALKRVMNWYFLYELNYCP